MRRRGFLAALACLPIARRLVRRTATEPKLVSFNEQLKRVYSPTFIRTGVGRYTITLPSPVAEAHRIALGDFVFAAGDRDDRAVAR